MGCPVGTTQRDKLWLKNQKSQVENCQLSSDCNQSDEVTVLVFRQLVLRLSEYNSWHFPPSTLFSINHLPTIGHHMTSLVGSGHTRMIPEATGIILVFKIFRRSDHFCGWWVTDGAPPAAASPGLRSQSLGALQPVEMPALDRERERNLGCSSFSVTLGSVSDDDFVISG